MKLKLLLGFVLLYLPLQTMAWGNEGHQICGQIAWGYLTPKAKAAVNAILGGEHIAIASTWADDIKKDPQYKYTSPWHYIDLDKAYTYPELVNYLNRDRQEDVYTKTIFLISELRRKNLSRSDQVFDLKMLIHLVEDAQQPLHVGHADDLGGNKFMVSWQGEPTNLHAVWDTKLIEFQRIKYSKYAYNINHTSATQIADWQKAPLSRWIFESNQIAEKLYTDVKPGDDLGDAYSRAHVAVLNKQLLKAGVRLAGVLNSIFG